MSGHRRAAAALYSLAGSDQERILAELPEHDQQILKDYLAELASLGFDKAANMAEAVANAPLAPAAPEAPRLADPLQRLRQADAGAMHGLLAGEPAGLVAQVIALETWPWAAQLLELMSPERRQQVRDAAPAAAAPARTRFLIDALSAALGQAPAVVAAPRAPSARRKWLPWTR